MWAGGASGTVLLTAYDDIARPAIALEAFELPWPSPSAFIGDILAMSFVSSLLCGIGWAILGFPLSQLLRRFYRAPWLALLALLSAGGVGGLVCAKIVGAEDSFREGAAWGGSTGLWYWFLYRRALIRGVAAAEAAAPEA